MNVVNDNKMYAQGISEATISAIIDNLFQTVEPPKKKSDLTCISLDRNVYHTRIELFKYSLIGKLMLNKGDKLLG